MRFEAIRVVVPTRSIEARRKSEAHDGFPDLLWGLIGRTRAPVLREPRRDAARRAEIAKRTLLASEQHRQAAVAAGFQATATRIASVDSR